MEQRLLQFNKSLLSIIAFMLISFMSFAQDKKIDVDINTKSGSDESFFMKPWVWVIGGAVFVLLLVALLRGGRKN